MPTTSKYLIYALCEPFDGPIRYVGKSVRGLLRPREHFWQSSLKHCSLKNGWIKSLKTKGLLPEVVVLETVDDIADVDESERFWIAQCRAMGFRLTNMTDGGDGVCGRVVTKEEKQKLSKALKGRKCPFVAESNKRRKGEKKPHTREHGVAISKAKLGKNIGRPLSESHRIAIARGQGGRPVLETTTNTRFETCAEAARYFQITPDRVCKVALGRATRVNGLVFKYLEVEQ